NPYHVKKSKEFDDNSPSKNDKKDAGLIAKLIKDGRYFDMHLSNDVYSELKVLTTTREQLVSKRKNSKNIVIAIIDEYFPEYEKIYKNIFSEGSMKLLKTYPFPEEILRVGVEEIESVLKESTKGKDWRGEYENILFKEIKPYNFKLFCLAFNRILSICWFNTAGPVEWWNLQPTST
ncbi:MAG: transposase, partial [Fervidobacterium sp.]|uniref:IS110 family transposase n=1 Tax=Fervidobacterium sp. TaxID=1871331 RepID=UPI0030A2FA4C